MNAMLADWAAATPNFYLHDLCWLSASVGVDNWCARPRRGTPTNMRWICSTSRFVPQRSQYYQKHFRQKQKGRCADLDNTLWGGVIGDDGPEGVELGNETPTGMAYTAFQSYLKELSGMGVLLNVCSKNEKPRQRPALNGRTACSKQTTSCASRPTGAKVPNIDAIAGEINILPDSLVFLDDNPAEREIVRQELPTVTVPELAAPEEYARVLDRGGWFEATAVSADDRRRGEMYRQNLQRAAARQSFGNYEDYLRSLEMRCELGPFDTPHAERITQLINKTNQFNLTTRRYTAAEVEALMNDPACVTLYGRLLDKFGDNGIVTALIGRQTGDALDIELWIMSCRTFKRNLEYALFDRLVDVCRERGIKTINGIYLPTAKNLLVADFYATIGFEKISGGETGSVFRYTVPAERTPLNTVMETVLL